MKKIGLFILAFICLVGCSSVSELHVIEDDKAFLLQDELEFELIKSDLTQDIVPSNKNQTYNSIKVSNQEHYFIDLTVKTANLTQKEKSLSQIYNGYYEVNKQKYNLELAIESVDYNQISQTDTLKPNESRYVHLYCEVPKNQIKDSASITFEVLKQERYQYIFSIDKKIKNPNKKALGDILNLEQSQIVFNTIEESKQVEPSHKGFVYNYIPTDQPDEEFVILKIDVKNNTTNTINPKKYLYCEYGVGKEKVKSKMIIESENHQSVSQVGTIKPNEIKTIYLAMPVHKDLLDKPGTIHFFVEGQTFELNK